MVLALNTVSGQIADVSPKTLLHPTFKNVLVLVEPERKPYNPVMYKPGTVEEKIEQESGFFKKFRNETKEEDTESNIDIEEEN
jgi:hypothetical protein